jgi:hypothetical protein
MNPLVHMLAGAALGQASPGGPWALAGGVLTHELLDAIPHAEGETFGLRGISLLRVDVLEAGAEVLVGAALLWRLTVVCSGARADLVVLGAFGGLLPDLVDIPLQAVWGKMILHVRRLHWTVGRQHAVLGVLAQIVTAGVAGALLWFGSCR